MICQFCNRDPDLVVNPADTYSTETLLQYKEAGMRLPRPHKQGHDCFCHRSEIEKNGELVVVRTAWGVCCAKYTVVEELMLEEDYHAQLPWSKKSDCTCSCYQEKSD